MPEYTAETQPQFEAVELQALQVPRLQDFSEKGSAFDHWPLYQLRDVHPAAYRPRAESLDKAGSCPAHPA